MEEGIDVALDAEPIAVDGASGDKVRLRVATHDGERVIEGSDLLVAAGRTPNTQGSASRSGASSWTRVAT